MIICYQFTWRIQIGLIQALKDPFGLSRPTVRDRPAGNFSRLLWRTNKESARKIFLGDGSTPAGERGGVQVYHRGTYAFKVPLTTAKVISLVVGS